MLKKHYVSLVHVCAGCFDFFGSLLQGSANRPNCQVRVNLTILGAVKIWQLLLKFSTPSSR